MDGGALQPVDAVEVTVLVDNFVDILLPGGEVAARPAIDFGMFERDREKLLAEHGLSLLLAVERARPLTGPAGSASPRRRASGGARAR